ncbi:MAG TPA: molecular chaperone DnaK, partial [Rhodospirillaceae bacterium]|nr:molecular chaperone DnaK [Rhodospirillaceae bacterium]
QIEVTFDIDANGIVQVSAKDKATNKEQQIRIQASGGLSDADIEQMVKDAEANADADKERREAVEAKNQAESLVHSSEKTLEELGDDVPADDKQTVEEAIAALKTALEGDSAEEIKAKTEELSQAAMKLGELAYKKAQEESVNEGAEEASTPEDEAPEAEVVDAEFEDVDDSEDDKKASK